MRQEVCPQCGVYLPALLRDVLAPGTTLRGGTYRIDYELGQGGFGITYRAVHLALERTVTVKEFYPREQAMRDATTGGLSVPSTQRDAYARALQRFMREGRTLARLSHSGVVRVSDLFEERATGYMAMELVEGRTLRELLDSRPGRRLPPDEAGSITAQLVEALEAVHAQGVYHLDIKPDNLIVRPDGQLVVVDFGAARQGFTGGSTQAFTLEYAAPEVLSGDDVGPQSDLFEAGMVLHEMLTGQRPAPALSRILRDNWRPAPLEEPWHGLIASALRVDKDARPPTMREWWAQRDGPRVVATAGDYLSFKEEAQARPSARPDPSAEAARSHNQAELARLENLKKKGPSPRPSSPAPARVESPVSPAAVAAHEHNRVELERIGGLAAMPPDAGHDTSAARPAAPVAAVPSIVTRRRVVAAGALALLTCVALAASIVYDWTPGRRGGSVNIAVDTPSNSRSNTSAPRHNFNMTREEYERNKDSVLAEARRMGRTIGGGADDGWNWLQIRGRLAAAEDLRDATINVDVDNGYVMLTGSVANGAQKVRATALVKESDPRLTVLNALRVRGSANPAR